MSDGPITLHSLIEDATIKESAHLQKMKNEKRPIPRKTNGIMSHSASSADDKANGNEIGGGGGGSVNEEEVQRLNAAHLLATHMRNGTEPDSNELLDAIGDDAPLHKRYKRYLSVESGSTLCALEREVASANPALALPAVRAKARAELKKREKRTARLQWQTNAPDSALLPQLRADRSPEAERLVESFEATHAKMNAKLSADVAMQTSFNTLRRDEKKRIRLTERRVVADANKLLGVAAATTTAPTTAETARRDAEQDGDAAPPTTTPAPLAYAVTDQSRLNDAPSEAKRFDETASGLAVPRNSAGDVIVPNVYPMGDFATYFAASKSRSEETMGNDAAQCLARFHANTVNAFLKMLDAAPADACLTADGERPSGSISIDLRRILEANHFNTTCISNERLLKYQALFQQTHTPVPADIEAALAVRAVQIDRDRARDVMRRIGMSEVDIDSAMLFGKSAERNAFIRAVMQSINSDAFMRAESQAEEATALAKRVKQALSAKGGGRDAPASTSGGRGREALGLAPESAAADDQKQEPQPHASSAKKLGVSLEVVTRAYLQSFMRPAVFEGERPCVREEMCLCNTMAASFPAMLKPEAKSSGFVAKELLLPSQMATYDTHRKLPEHRALCVICDRAAVTEAVFDHVQNRREPLMPLHGYMVEVDVPGGYRRDLLIEPIVCGTRLTGIIGPFPALNPQNLVYGKVKIDERLYNCLLETETDFQTGSASIPRF